MKEASAEITRRIHRFELKHTGDSFYTGNFFKFNRQVERNINAVIKKLTKDIDTIVINGIATGWELSNLKNNEFVSGVVGDTKLPKGLLLSWNQTNLGALNAFINRSSGGLGLSDRVWKSTREGLRQIEMTLSSGITVGRPANVMAKDLKDAVIEPNRIFRRIRKDGELVLSRMAKKYHPGQGVYRSSFKNARRLAANETNMSYRTSDFERRKQLPFVVGITVHLSPQHPEIDICDSMKGDYPKGFLFMGWHTQCFCFTTSKQLSVKERVEYFKGGTIRQQRYTSSIPKTATNYISKHKKTIQGYKTKPFFLEQNFTEDFKLNKSVTDIK